MLPLALIGLHNQLWYILPLLVVISLVYGATRDERMAFILQHAYRVAVGLVGFILVIFAILWGISWLV